MCDDVGSESTLSDSQQSPGSCGQRSNATKQHNSTETTRLSRTYFIESPLYFALHCTVRCSPHPFFSDDTSYAFEFSALLITIVTISCGLRLLYLARFSIVFSLRIASENIARSDETDAAAD